MKFHRSTIEAVIQSLEMIFVHNKYADKVIEKVLKQNKKWGARDRKFIAETTYDIVRWYRLLQYVSSSDDFWKLLGAQLLIKHGSCPPWEEFKSIDKATIFQKARNTDRKISQSIPDWLDELCYEELGERWESELSALNEEAKVVLRVNTLKTTVLDLQQRLKEDGIETLRDDRFPDALILNERQNIFKHASFSDGLFEVQDAASQLIAPFLNVKPGMRAIDACAGAGGKTLHLAALMNNKGRLIGMDVEKWKLDELKLRARRAGVTNLELRQIDTGKVIKRLENTADRLLLDVPCSGLGVLRRNPDAKWKLSKKFIDEVKLLQQHILKDYCTIVKPGGYIVYATCSILNSENESQVKLFLDQHPAFELIEEKRAWPSDGFDGFYMALIKRNN